MVKVHTRIKRKFGLTTSHGCKKNMTPCKKIHGPKTFSTKESADNYAKKNNIENYTLVPAKKNKRFAIIK